MAKCPEHSILSQWIPGTGYRRHHRKHSRQHLKVPLKIALLIETSNSYARGLLRGIVSYNREHRPWSLYLSEHNRGDKPPRWLAHWKGSGIIARIENSAIAAALRQVSVPMVDVSAARLIPSLPWFETDDQSAAAHEDPHDQRAQLLVLILRHM